MPRSASVRLLVSAQAEARLGAADAWLAEQPPDAEILLLASSPEAADEALHRACDRTGARFGTNALTLDRFALRIAAPVLYGSGLVPASPLAFSAGVARAAHLLAARGGLPYFAPVARRPGFAQAAARTVEELGMNAVDLGSVAALPRGGADLAELAATVHSELAAAGLAARPALFRAAAAHAAVLSPFHGLLLLDLPLEAEIEVRLVAALAGRARTVLATAPHADARAREGLRRVLGCSAVHLEPAGGGSLRALVGGLFEESAGLPAPLDASVSLTSWPGEARECVEIARAIRQEAERGVRFDAMAVLLRSPQEYRPPLEEAFRRAAVPAYFARGARRPDPAGRALLALLACAAERLSARRFAEYVSLGQVPDESAAREAAAVWRPPAPDLVPGAALEEPLDPELPDIPSDPEAGGRAGSLRAPWRWDRLVVDASVIGGKERWRRRLEGLAEELGARRRSLPVEDEARAALLDRRIEDLAHLSAFALPLIERLAGLPERGSWGEWLGHLRALAAAALRRPAGVLATLAELEPAAPVAPVTLDEVQAVLTPRLRDLPEAPPRRRYGAVFVGTCDAARGLAFRIVFVPGLAERLFPRKTVEDPILLDRERRRLAAPGLETQAARVARERLALHLASGAASERVYLSYPRVDVEQARPRVPSFYGLEALRAAEGELPGFEELSRRAQAMSPARLGWPAPERPDLAVDDAEYDLALLAPLLAEPASSRAGGAAYLLDANPHLGRALRARARRWIRRWTAADGLVDPEPIAREALSRHQVGSRSFSPTALQHFAACPYRFFLQAVHRLEPAEEPVAIEMLDPLTRGSLFHDIQFEILTRLARASALPLTADRLREALAEADVAVATVAAGYAEQLAPAIPRVWDDGVASIRADVHEWLRRAALDPGGWVPHRFELAFGLADRDRPLADPASVDRSVAVAGLDLRGSIDLVERRPDGRLRATDHKTGKARAAAGVVVGGGKVLQPVFYALACEKLLGEPVEAGRLYYCTADGGYVERTVPLDATSRAAAEEVVRIVSGALSEGFLPAAPDRGACGFCDYRPVCGPYEEIRSARKPADRLEPLRRLRELP